MRHIGIAVGLVAASLGLLLALACAGPVPTPAPTPTPSTPYWPTYLDLDMVARLKTQGYSQGAYDYSVIKRQYPAFAGIYVARECFAGNPLTPEGFRTFVDQTAAQTRAMNGRDANALVAAQARDVAGRLLALQGKDVRGSCIEPFMYPKTGAEAYLGRALIEIAMLDELSRTYGAAGVGYAVEILPGPAVAQWFQQEAGRGEPFVPWLWARPELRLEPLAQIPSTVPVPKGDTQLPITWAMDYQLSVMQMINAQQAGTISEQASTILALCQQVKTLSVGFICH